MENDSFDLDNVSIRPPNNFMLIDHFAYQALPFLLRAFWGSPECYELAVDRSYVVARLMMERRAKEIEGEIK